MWKSELRKSISIISHCKVQVQQRTDKKTRVGIPTRRLRNCGTLRSPLSDRPPNQPDIPLQSPPLSTPLPTCDLRLLCVSPKAARWPLVRPRSNERGPPPPPSPPRHPSNRLGHRNSLPDPRGELASLRRRAARVQGEEDHLFRDRSCEGASRQPAHRGPPPPRRGSARPPGARSRGGPARS